MKHFDAHHRHSKDGTFVVPLPKTSHPLIFGESRSMLSITAAFTKSEEQVSRISCHAGIF